MNNPLPDIKKFNFPEGFNNSKGKTSIALVSGYQLVTTGCLIGIIGAFLKVPEVLFHAVAFASLGAGLLGIRRFTNDKEIHCPPVCNQEEQK